MVVAAKGDGEPAVEVGSGSTTDMIVVHNTVDGPSVAIDWRMPNDRAAPMTDPDQRLPGMTGIDQPSVARMYDYYLGGSHNFEVDRAAARAAIDAAPQIVAAARANRDFLMHVVEFAVTNGIRQFLDLGSGIPTVGNVHEVAHQRDPATRVVYVDHDPIAVTYAQALLADEPHISVLSEDVRHLPAILEQVADQRLLDLDRPIATLLISVAHFIPGDIAALLEPLRQLVPGSLLAISHATAGPDHSPRQLDTLRQTYAATPSGIYPRTEADILAMFTGFPLVPADHCATGVGQLVPVDAWRPEPRFETPQLTGFLAGVGIRPPVDNDADAAPPNVSRTTS